LELAHHILSPQDLTNTISQTYINNTGKTATGFFIENLSNKTNNPEKRPENNSSSSKEKQSKNKIARETEKRRCTTVSSSNHHVKETAIISTTKLQELLGLGQAGF
jgi:predicted peptidase